MEVRNLKYIMDYTSLVDNIILTYKDNPIDLLNIGAGETEYAYLNELKYSYVRTISDVVPLLQKGMKILEVGSLFGVVSIALKQLGFSVTGIDIPEFHQSVRLRKLYAKHDIPFDKANLRHYKLPYLDKSFDMVIACEVIEHFNFNPLPVFQEINRVLKNGGYVDIATPNQACIDNRLKLLIGRSVHERIQYFFDQLDRNKNIIVSTHWREYTMKEAVEIFERMDFQIIRKHYFKENGPTKMGIESFIKWFFHLIPSLRTSLAITARKEKDSKYDFWFTEANS
jgi:ubiquinone/menaquinone biosynthesis C-methylase UbiE